MALTLFCLSQWVSRLHDLPTLEEQLWEATRDNDDTSVSHLLAFPGIAVNLHVPPHDLTPLQLACSKGHVAVLSLLLNHPGIDVNQASDLGATPLHLACQWGHTEVVKLLLRDPRIRINLTDTIGATPVWWAARAGYVELVCWMVASRRVLQLKERAGSLMLTAEEVAARGGHVDIAELLREFAMAPERGLSLARHKLGLTGAFLLPLHAFFFIQ